MPSTDTQPIRIVCSADEKYVMPLSVMVKSALRHISPRRSVLLYIVNGGVGENNKQRLLDSWALDHQSVQWIEIDDALLPSIPLWGRMTIHTYHRILMPRLLPQSVGKAIWLDCDIIVKRDLAELWDMDLGNYAALAVQDMVVPYVSSPYGIVSYKELGIPPHAKYFNAGVMVVNLNWWRDQEVADNAFAFLKKYWKTIFFWDQEALNAVLVGKWGALDPRWNQIASVSGRRFFVPRHLHKSLYEKVVDDPWIVHFAGTWKPWLYESDNPAYASYFQYLDQTAWAGWRPEKTLSSRIARIYEERLRNVLYPMERWGLKLLKRATIRLTSRVA